MCRSLKAVGLIAILTFGFGAWAWSDQAVPVSGRWDIIIQYVYGSGTSTAYFEQEGEKLFGTCKGRFNEGELYGVIQGSQIQFTCNLKTEGIRLTFNYKGVVERDKMTGTLTLGEYGDGKWTATKPKRSQRNQ